MRVAIVKYNAGNIRSVENALRRLSVDPVTTDVAAEIATADRVVFPGVGEASSAMRYLRERGLDKTIRSLSQPVLAICLGMQLLCGRSEENDAECLGILPYRVRRFANADHKVPHMGWNTLVGPSMELFKGVPAGSRVYFVHGYYVEQCADTIATTTYGETFSAAVRRDNFFGVQFHPEKSGDVGARILANFLSA